MSRYIIETKRLGLRRWQESDSSPFYKLNQDQRVMEFFPKTLTKEESDSMIIRIEENISKNGFGFYAVELLENTQFIGFIGLSIPSFEAEFTPCVEIGWRLDFEFWGHGYATEGATACLDYAFNKLDLSEIVSFTTVTNKRSQTVMQKIGMKKAGEFKHPKLDVGHPLCEHVLYKITKEDFNKMF